MSGLFMNGILHRHPAAMPKASMATADCPVRAGTVIMLHGLGDSGDGWAPVGAEWAPELRHVKFIFPHAPNVRRVGARARP